MASNLPSSFASAAAGQSSGRDPRGRGDSRGPEWSRRDGRSSNGTLTFRRPSATPQSLSQSSAIAESPLQTPIPDPALASPTPPAPTSIGAARYSKEQLLELSRSAGGAQADVSRLFMDGWSPGAGQVNGGASRGWGKPTEYNTGPEADMCWSSDAGTKPLGLQEMSAEEKEAFQDDVNSPMKPPPQNKDGAQATGPNGRKASVSQGSGNPYNITSPTSARPGTRRRESIDRSPFAAGVSSPTTGGNRFARDDGSPWFSRKATDPRGSEKLEADDNPDPSKDVPQSKPSFNSLLRGTTSPSPAGLSSLWPPSTSQPAPTGVTGSGIGGFGNFALPAQSPVKPFGGGRGESRLAHLMPKDSSENIASKLGGDSSTPDPSRAWRSRPRTDTDPFGDEGLSGSGLLSAVRDSTPPVQSGQGPFDAAARGTIGDLGLSSLQLGQGGRDSPLSPANTNPYRSPPTERRDPDDHDDDFEKRGGMMDQMHSFRNPTPRGYPANAFDGSDRSQTSSAGPNRYPTLSSLAGWPAPPATVGTPDRERAGFGSAFGNTLFSPVGDGLGGLGSVFGPPGGASNTGSIGRGSKLGSLFPAAMQAQMQSQDPENLGDSVPDLQQNNPLGAIGRGNLPGQGRDAGPSGRPAAFDDIFGAPSESGRGRGLFSSGDGQPGISAAAQQPSFASAAPGGPFPTGQPSGDAPPSAQVRQMVMPDRMRWVYLDPQGQVQGPFTGLEMNDWYKANFFTPDLRVKKIEDSDFEPLGQLIRRIGNSREPFLVPQIGVPHGPAPQGASFSPTGNTGVVPPLSGVFPSYGRTLTAEEQNNLERRKQEEQILMAQQREFILRQQPAPPKFPMAGAGGISGSLNHHSSAQSLQSQPSFGSITSPIGPPGQGPVGQGAPGSGGPFDSNAAAQQSVNTNVGSGLDGFQEHDLMNLTTPERQVIATLQDSAGMSAALQGGAAGQGGLAGLRSQLPATNQLNEDVQGFRERLMEFEQLRTGLDQEARGQMSPPQHGSFEAEQPESAQKMSAEADPTGEAQPSTQSQEAPAGDDGASHAADQGQKAQGPSAADLQASGLPMPFPPPEPLEGEVPEVPAEPAQPPPMAPWAKEASSENHRGPSLKEIQEAEARNAAKAEQAAQAARRAAMEQEAAEIREKERAAAAAAVAPGLPTTSTWGQPSPAQATSPWAKPAAPKATGAAGPTAAAQAEKKRKTLAEIQKEEEARKQKSAAQSQAAPAASAPSGGGVSIATPAGKRYADLASKPNPPGMQPAAAAAVPGSGWATVGAGGKVKAPPGAAPSPPARTPSVGAPKAAPKPVVKPAVVPAAPKPDGATAAMEEFKKWLHRELSRGITGVSNIDDFAATLQLLPLDMEMISDAVYANSTTMNGQHFAEEFIRRKKLAEKGIAEKQPGSDGPGGSGGGWNEVAKKGGHGGAGAATAGAAKEEAPAGFRVVPGRKKGKK